MPDVRPGNPVALCISDVHFSDKPPRIRAGEDDWIESQLHYIDQLHSIWEKQNEPMILIAGDVFHVPSPSLKLVNAVSDRIKDKFPTNRIYTIYGNHDLPYHRLTNRKRCGLYTLARSGAVVDLEDLGGHLATTSRGNVWVQPFSWGTPPSMSITANADLSIAVVHKYAYYLDTQKYFGHTGSNVESDNFEGFDVVHYGDNHIRWDMGRYINPGAFIRRTKNDLDIDPAVYAVYIDGSYKAIELDTAGDQYEVVDTPVMREGFQVAINEVQEDQHDVAGYFKVALEGCDGDVKDRVFEILQECQ